MLDRRFGIDTEIVGHLVRAGEAKAATDVHDSSSWPSAADHAIWLDSGVPMCAPLFNNERTYGAIEVVNNVFANVFEEVGQAAAGATARCVGRALAEAEDTTLLEGESS